MKRIYMDHASATPVLPAAARAVARAMERLGNPGATHAEAVAAKQLLQKSREQIAQELACKPREVIFTSGLSEANNLAILGFARHLLMTHQDDALMGTHWVVSSIEHDSVLECFAEVERMGGKVTHLDPDGKGIIAADAVTRALKPETVIVSIGWGNNEIGVIQPLRSISLAIKEHEKKHGAVVALHSDAGQAPLYLHPTVHTLGVDLFALGSGKLYGPRGTGALYVSNRVTLAPVQLGGGQERGLRAGTEDVALAAGFASAVEGMSKAREKEARRLRKLRDEFAGSVTALFPDVVLNTDLARCLPHILNVSLPGINAEYTALALDRKGIAISTKSACNEGDTSSHVVAALGGPEWRSRNTLRFSLGLSTTSRDLSNVLEALKDVMSRGIS